MDLCDTGGIINALPDAEKFNNTIFKQLDSVTKNLDGKLLSDYYRTWYKHSGAPLRSRAWQLKEMGVNLPSVASDAAMETQSWHNFK